MHVAAKPAGRRPRLRLGWAASITPLSAAGHNRESEPGNRRAHFQGQFVIPIVRFDSRRTEDDHARTNEMKSAISRRKSRMTRSNVQNSANRERSLPEIFHQRAPAE